MSVQRKDKPTKPSVDGVTTPGLKVKAHGRKSTRSDALSNREKVTLHEVLVSVLLNGFIQALSGKDKPSRNFIKQIEKRFDVYFVKK